MNRAVAWWNEWQYHVLMVILVAVLAVGVGVQVAVVPGGGR